MLSQPMCGAYASRPALTRAFGDALVTVPVGDAPALAGALRALRGPARLAVADRARAVFEQHYSESALADQLALILAGFSVWWVRRLA